VTALHSIVHFDIAIVICGSANWHATNHDQQLAECHWTAPVQPARRQYRSKKLKRKSRSFHDAVPDWHTGRLSLLAR
jgi:hypothetical protein